MWNFSNKHITFLKKNTKQRRTNQEPQQCARALQGGKLGQARHPAEMAPVGGAVAPGAAQAGDVSRLPKLISIEKFLAIISSNISCALYSLYSWDSDYMHDRHLIMSHMPHCSFLLLFFFLICVFQFGFSIDLVFSSQFLSSAVFNLWGYLVSELFI